MPIGEVHMRKPRRDTYVTKKEAYLMIGVF